MHNAESTGLRWKTGAVTVPKGPWWRKEQAGCASLSKVVLLQTPKNLVCFSLHQTHYDNVANVFLLLGELF